MIDEKRDGEDSVLDGRVLNNEELGKLAHKELEIIRRINEKTLNYSDVILIFTLIGLNKDYSTGSSMSDEELGKLSHIFSNIQGNIEKKLITLRSVEKILQNVIEGKHQGISQNKNSLHVFLSTFTKINTENLKFGLHFSKMQQGYHHISGNQLFKEIKAKRCKGKKILNQDLLLYFVNNPNDIPTIYRNRETAFWDAQFKEGNVWRVRTLISSPAETKIGSVEITSNFFPADIGAAVIIV